MFARLSEAIRGVYDNCTTIGSKFAEDPIRRLGDAFGRMTEKVAVSARTSAIALRVRRGGKAFTAAT